ncbi:hypothetical protein BJ508DRAFT_307125 [Ascobolus immersus RN42]|uniref:Uncharacterized protein n=1 Tax=Ascobolus immersus RN42 TaxID=1160509 RepID=A0A3N4I971_ASCIM|nr:hypothetical protein BJ508DRAFT_307125 [Ascobolus immersus RN42]
MWDYAASRVLEISSTVVSISQRVITTSILMVLSWAFPSLSVEVRKGIRGAFRIVAGIYTPQSYWSRIGLDFRLEVLKHKSWTVEWRRPSNSADMSRSKKALSTNHSLHQEVNRRFFKEELPAAGADLGARRNLAQREKVPGEGFNIFGEHDAQEKVLVERAGLTIGSGPI